MGEKTKGNGKIIIVVVAIVAATALVVWGFVTLVINLVTQGGTLRVNDNYYGGKTYVAGPNKHRGEYRHSEPLPEQFPSDKIPVLANSNVGRYRVDYDKYETLKYAEIYMHTRTSSKEVAEAYKNYYSDAKYKKEKIHVNEYEEEYNRYEYVLEKEGYIYTISIDRSPKTADTKVNYSAFTIKMEPKRENDNVKSDDDLERVYGYN